MSSFWNCNTVVPSIRGLQLRTGEGIAGEFRMDMCTLLQLKWITNKDLLYSTWNSAQCYVTAWVVVGFGENGYIYMYGWVFRWPPETITVLFVNLLHPNTKFKKKFFLKKHSFNSSISTFSPLHCFPSFRFTLPTLCKLNYSLQTPSLFLCSSRYFSVFLQQ